MRRPGSIEKVLSAWVTDAADRGVFTTDDQLRITSWNHWLERHTGRDAVDAIGQSLLTLYPDLVARGIHTYYRDALDGRVSVLPRSTHGYLLPIAATRDDGDSEAHLPQRARIGPAVIDGRPVGTVTVIDDVSEDVATESGLRRQLRAEQEARTDIEAALRERDRAVANLRESDARFRRATHAAGTLIYDLDVRQPDHLVVHGLEAVIGHALEGRVDRGWWHAQIHPDDLPRHLARLEQNLASSIRRYTDTYRLRHANGTWREVENLAEIERHVDGTATRVVGTIVDVTYRLATLRELRTSEEHLRVATQIAGLGTFDVDLFAGRIQRSPRCAELVGRPDVLELSVDEALAEVHPEDVAPASVAFVHAFEANDDGEAQTEFRVTRPDGTTRWLLLSTRVMFEGAGDERVATRVIGAVLDTTDRHTREAALKAREARQRFIVSFGDALRGLATPADVLSTATRLVGQHLDVDRAYVADVDEARNLASVRHEYRRADLDGIAGDYPLRDFIDASRLHIDRAIVVNDVTTSPLVSTAGREASAALSIGAFVAVPLVRNGALKWTLNVTSREPRAWTPGDVAVLQEVSERTWTTLERTRAESALREAEQRFRIMADEAPVIIWVTDATGGLQFINRGYAEYFGVTLDDVTRGGWQVLLHPDDSAYETAFFEALAARTPFRATGRVRDRDGAWRWIASSGLPRFDDSGEFLGMIGVSMDVTDQRAATEMQRQAARQKDEFIAVLAHELRNPLAPIRTAVGLWRAHGSSDPVLERCRDIIDRQVSQMARLLDDLLDVSRLSQGKLTLQRARVRLHDIIDAALETARPVIDDRQHALDVAAIDPGIELDADGARLIQVFANLLNNAAKYTPPGGRVRLTAHAEAGSVAVTVHDSGVGIAPEMRERVFDLFTQVGEARERADGGLGIGLGLARRLVEMHGGAIAVESGGSGQGSAFTVTLPTVAHGQADVTRRHERVAAPRSQPTRRRVLVADDNTDAADAMSLLLGVAGCEVRAVYDGESALREARTFKPDLVLLDLGMPRISGQVVCRCIRSESWGADMVIAAVTGWGQDDDRRRTAMAGFDHHLVKPVEPEQLWRLLDSVPRPRAEAAESGGREHVD